MKYKIPVKLAPELLMFMVAGLLSIFQNPVPACTTAVISGKCTPDGRPVLFKHRDSDSLANKVAYFSDGKFDYIGLINSHNPDWNEVWIGFNSTGFAIMNSASYNLNLQDTAKIKDREGFLMKKALQECETVSDFENMLKSLKHPAGIEANFGVIDASEGAAYFETGNYDYTKYDVNDPRIAPFGYLIRSNYSFSRNADEGAGYIRYETAHDLFMNASATGNMTVDFLFRDVSRCLRQSLTEINLYENLPLSESQPVFVPFRDFIVRHYSTASVAIQGVRTGEDPVQTTFWCMPGLPIASVAVPLWLIGGPDLPGVMTAPGAENAPLSECALKLREICFPISRGSGRNYLNLAAVINQENTGIIQKLIPLEEEIMKEARERMSIWRKSGFNRPEVQKFYQWVNGRIINGYRDFFGIAM